MLVKWQEYKFMGKSQVVKLSDESSDLRTPDRSNRLRKTRIDKRHAANQQIAADRPKLLLNYRHGITHWLKVAIGKCLPNSPTTAGPFPPQMLIPSIIYIFAVDPIEQ
uniref:Uncharacterized protein n=1 Tax=Globodera rostochiensis TaxID=31243 RepID=A0A914IDG5_GLORO